MPSSTPADVADGGVAFGRSLPGRVAHVRAVHLPQQAQASLGGQRGRDASAALLARLPAVGPESLLEPVDEAGHGGERGHRDDAQRHGSMASDRTR